MKLIIQNNWLFSDEGLAIQGSFTGIEHLSKEQIINLSYDPKTIIISDRDICQFIIKDTTGTYDSRFQDLYKRTITLTTFEVIRNPLNRHFKLPLFVKPKNTKDFDGFILTKDNLWIMEYDKEIYVSNVISIDKEIRLYIIGQKVYHEVVEDRLFHEFVSEILKRTQEQVYCIDVGLSNNEWFIIEINPNYSVSLYGISNDQYFEFVVAGWKSYQEIINLQNC